jgi:hypothetical protein
MAATVAVGGTLAWLNWSAKNPTANVFNVSGGGYNSAFTEPNFDPTVAKSMAPGIGVPKDPQDLINFPADGSTQPPIAGSDVLNALTPGGTNPNAGKPLSATDMAALLKVMALSTAATAGPAADPTVLPSSPTPKTTDLTAANNELNTVSDGALGTSTGTGVDGFNLTDWQQETDYTNVLTSAFTTPVSSDWTNANSTTTGQQYASEMLFYYDYDLLQASQPATAGVTNTGGETTNPLFSAVNINPNATSAELHWIEDFGGYNIVINSATVQSEASPDGPSYYNPNVTAPLTPNYKATAVTDKWTSGTNAGTSAATKLQSLLLYSGDTMPTSLVPSVTPAQNQDPIVITPAQAKQ